jgi:hypothetical protein
MRQVLFASVAAIVVGMGLASSAASAMPAASAPAASVEQGVINQVQWRRGGGFHGGYHGGYHGGPWRGGYYGHHNGWGGAALGAGAVGLATGAILGGALASPGYYGPGYYEPAPVYVEPGPTTIYSGGVGGDEAYCIRRFKSYDPGSGTYLGYDGLRHPCP